MHMAAVYWVLACASWASSPAILPSTTGGRHTSMGHSPADCSMHAPNPHTPPSSTLHTVNPCFSFLFLYARPEKKATFLPFQFQTNLTHPVEIFYTQ